MAQAKKISELTTAGTLSGLELVVVVQDGETRQGTSEQITASVSSRLDNVVSVNNAALTSINNTVSALEIRVSAVSARASVNAAAITSINAEVSLKVYRTGDYMTNARYIEFDTSASNGLTTGKLAWNSNDGTLDVGLLGTTVLQIGQETLFYVKNADTTTIADGRLVMATGVIGNSGKIEAQRANGSGAISAEYFLGIATQDIPVGEFGYVTHFGLVRGIDATGSQYGQTWAEADLLYPNTSIAGGLTNVPPPYPGFSTPIAIVVNAVSNAGSIFVRMKSGEYLEQLHDIDISAKASGDILVWSSTLGAWTNSQAFVSAQADVSALEIRVSAVSAVASANSAAITSINNVVSALEVRVSNASTINTTQTAAITSINNVVSALEIRVSNVSATNVTQTAAITSINNVVSALEIRVSAISAQAVSNAAAITSINSVVSALEIRVSSVSAAVVSINNVVSALEVRVSGVSATTSTLTAAITSVNAVVSLKVNRSGDTMTGNLTVPSLNSGPLAGFRNAFINGNFDIWQRGTSFSNPASGVYTTDRWYPNYDGSGATRTISRQAFTLGQTDVPGEPTYFFRFAQSVAGTSGTYNTIDQKIEGVRTFAGQQVTLSFYAKAAASLTMPLVWLRQYFGTGGSPSSPVDTTLVSSQSVTTSWTKYTYTATLPSISGKTIGNDNNDWLGVLLFLPVNTTFTFDLAQVQLEAGPVATPFERRPIGTELALCQRYYYSVSTAGVSYPFRGINQSTGYSDANIGSIHPVVMRAFPTGTIGWEIDDVVQGGNPTVFYVSPYYWQMIVEVSSGSFVDVTSITMSAEI